MTSAAWNTLPCGADHEALLAYAADHRLPPPGAHEATCPYCQVTIREFADLWHPVDQWATRHVPIPEHFTLSVMQRVRRVVQSPRHTVTVAALGVSTVTSWVLGLIVTAATLDTPGVRSISGSLAPHRMGWSRRRSKVRYGADGVDIAELGATDIGVTLSVTARSDVNLGELADLVRHNIVVAIGRQTGIYAAEVDITVDDIDP